MLDDLLDVFDRDRRHGERRGGLRGLLGRLAGDDHDGRGPDRRDDGDRRSATRDRDDHHDWDDDDRPSSRSRHDRREPFDLDD